jgi:hypothetical protein
VEYTPSYQASDSQKSDLNGKTNLFLNLFWIGFVVYTLVYTISVTGHIPFKLIVLFQIVQFSSLFMFLISAFVVMRYKIENLFLMITFILFCCWQLSVVFRGFIFNVEYIKTSLLDAWFGVLIYFAPFMILLPKEIISLKKMFNVIIILAVFYLLFDLIFIKELLYPYGGNRLAQALVEYFSRNLSIPCGFIVLTYIYHSNKKNLFSLFIIILTFLFAAVRARRTLMFMSMALLVISYLVFYFSNRGKIMKIVFSVILILSLGMYGAYVYTLQKNGAFGLLTSRMHEDTRSGVVKSFYRDMKTTDWIIGRGVNGQYFCPGIDEGNRITIYRIVIETGYLQIILKGGIISLALILIISIPAMIKGLFYSNNLLSKAAAIWIFWFLFNLYSSVGNAFILSYLLFWICVGICFEPGVLSKSDDEIKIELQKKLYYESSLVH